MKRLTSKKTWENASKDLSQEMGYSYIWKRLAAIEDILGDDYDLARLRELLEVCKDKTPDQVEGIFEEWSHYLKFSAERNAIEGTLSSIYQGGDVDYERLCELVEADREGRCNITPNFVYKIGETRGIIKVPYKSWMSRYIGTKFYKTEKEAKEHLHLHL